MSPSDTLTVLKQTEATTYLVCAHCGQSILKGEHYSLVSRFSSFVLKGSTRVSVGSKLAQPPVFIRMTFSSASDPCCVLSQLKRYLGYSCVPQGVPRKTV